MHANLLLLDRSKSWSSRSITERLSPHGFGVAELRQQDGIA